MSAFSNLDASEEGLEDNGITEIDSVCMSCYKQVTIQRQIRRRKNNLFTYIIENELFLCLLKIKGSNKTNANKNPVLS